MKGRKSGTLCIACNPENAQPGQYCDAHREELHRLDHQYETVFRLQRSSRGKDHESFNLFFMPGDCEPAGRIVVTETDPENLLIMVVITSDLDLETRITDYERLGIEKNYGDQLRERIGLEIVHSWYGNARACVDVFRTNSPQPQHWDVDPRSEQPDEEAMHPGGSGKHSIH
jgi:hypothetical protein